MSSSFFFFNVIGVTSSVVEVI